jgi:hypothetical protein
MQISQETLPVTKGWRQVYTTKDFLARKGDEKVFMVVKTIEDIKSPQTVVVHLNNTPEGVYVESDDHVDGWLTDIMQRLYPEVRAALGVRSQFIKNINELLSR